MFDLTDNIKNLIDLTDLFLLDVKHIDPIKCKNLVGFSNEKELAFAKYLNQINKPMWVRQVLIPGLTDDKQDLLKLKDFLHSLNNIQKFEFLPYHTMGKYKWENLGIRFKTSKKYFRNIVYLYLFFNI